MIVGLLFGISGVGKSTICYETKKVLSKFKVCCEIIEYGYIMEKIIEKSKKLELLKQSMIKIDTLPYLHTVLGDRNFREIYFQVFKDYIDSFSNENIKILLIPLQMFGIYKNELRSTINKQMINSIRDQDTIYLYLVESTIDCVKKYRKEKLIDGYTIFENKKYLSPSLIDFELQIERAGTSTISLLTSKPFKLIWNFHGNIEMPVNDLISSFKDMGMIGEDI